MVFNIRQKQSDVLLKVLNLNSPSGPGKDPGELYKVLVLDRYSKDIIAPLLRLNDLRRNGVTLHLMLEADRQPIPDVPAVYLVQPSTSNIDRIIADAAGSLYESMHLNFTSSLPSRLLEQLASGAVRSNAVSKVNKIFDQYVSFIALEPNMFSLGLADAYVQLNDPAAAEAQIEAMVNNIVDGLFSVCVTMGVVPIIRCPRGGAAEHVAGMLDQRLRDALKARSNLFSEGVLGLSASLSRPLLCLFDRNFDLAAGLAHGWTYKPMVHDVLGMKLNRITLAAEAGPGPGSAAAAAAAKPRAYDVDDRDFFWEACGSHAFPKVAEEVETQLQRYKQAVDEINARTAAGAAEGAYVDGDELLRAATASLMSAVSSLPELQEQKKTLDKHTNLATALLASIKARGLDAWHSTGEDVLAGRADLAAVLKQISGPRGNAADRLRLACVWLLSYEGMPSDADLGELERVLKAAGVDTTALAYVRSLKRNNLTGARGPESAPGGGMGGSGAAAQSSGALLDWADKTLGQGLSHVTKSIKTLVSGARVAPLTGAVEALAEGKAGAPEYDTYAVFDPKAPAGRAGLERAKGPFRDVMVFMIGGGSYLEREGLVAWAARSNASAGTVGAGAAAGGRAILYGATEILSGEELASQLAELGRRSGLGPGGVSLAPALPAAGAPHR
uniref:SM/Sec1-family protein n=1 Tax=Chlamydomonas leiostraca TaxID=1034604 RepID=A0A7S0RXY2_9CHLO|mmetsp:Transcript_34613/g.87571  ORF Transcript_34613/g.87571 Transcript_34613/m.87571 type:complete len:672 (+) Transcript_34613:100-2115(+)